MKANYPVADGKGGVTQQRLELKSRMQREGVQRLLKAAGVSLEGIRTIVDLGCRNGDSTLGLAQIADSDTRIIGVEEVEDAVRVAKVKFSLSSAQEYAMVRPFLDQVPRELWKEFSTTVMTIPEDRFPSFVAAPLGELPQVCGKRPADLIVGSQLLHWIDADGSGLPKMEILKAIHAALAAGGTFVASTSTAFVQMDPYEKVEGKTRERYLVDNHPFFQMVYKAMADIAEQLTGRVPQPISVQPPLSMEGLAALFQRAGFSEVRTGAHLTTFGSELAMTEQVRIRPIHQGRLAGVPLEQHATVMDAAMAFAEAQCRLIVAGGKTDPRITDTQHLYDANPFIVAKK